MLAWAFKTPTPSRVPPCGETCCSLVSTPGAPPTVYRRPRPARPLRSGLTRSASSTPARRQRAMSWERTDVARVAGGSGKALSYDGRDLASVDLPDGDALVLFRDLPPLGYLALTEADRDPRPPAADGAALDAKAGGGGGGGGAGGDGGGCAVRARPGT